MAILVKEKYDQGKIDKLGRYLQFYSQMGEPIDYEILVDGFKAVRRTNDPALFGLFQTFVNPDSQSVVILFYKGASNNNEKRIFYLHEPSEQEGHKNKDAAWIEEKVNRMMKEKEVQELRNENGSLRKEITELECEISRWKKRYGIDSPPKIFYTD